ncbi:pyrroloquinoline-quinone glucose dehydrogenase [Patiriisocius marinistellae]|uniref:Pyrroloquinoline-quinone glucose dehydrogenase n=1 Tax=Patiriisocius marinistellae TaxID=2494560 RepID=A0A5J4FY26_9FLAO|nr:PQQ-dependent sugar dehydrogenase [Patiriisocius marinistellae]GEQ86102.1 pyrroloquinoline-quinone glucose dehydrogenase [Patiriisocius marinistellae]
MKTYLSIVSLLILFASCQAPKKKNDIALNSPVTRGYKTQKVVDNLSNPWGMTWLPDGAMLITEKSGELIHFKNGTKTEVKNVPEVYNRGQGGLLDIKLHPNYKQNGWIYITHASTDGDGNGGHTKLIRCKLSDELVLTDIETLYKATPNTTKGQHFGSRIEFDNDGFIYFSIGERGERDVNPQDKTRDGGKIYRLNDDGSIPKDNPFVNETGVKKAIYTFGNRNPQGMDLHPTTGKIWIHEHGPKGGDEVNIVKKGANYGWPVISYGVNYSGSKFTEKTSQEGMEQPIYYWVPSIAPCGMTFVTGDVYPDWKGDLLVGSLKFNYVELLELEGDKVTGRKKIAEDIGRVRNVEQAPDGYIYIAVEGDGIYKVIPE